MVDFTVGAVYKSKKGVDFKITEIKNGLATIQHLNYKRKARIITWCGVKALTFDFGSDMILAEPIKPFDDLNDDLMVQRPSININKSGESYVSLFKRHYKENT